jgi:hypothetical protein
MKRQLPMFLGIVLAMLATKVIAQQRALPPDPYDAGQAMQHPVNTAPISNQPALPAANDYPAAEVQAVPAARARVALTRAQADNAQSALHDVVYQLKEDFEISADLSTAMRNEQAAHDRYNQARDHALAHLNDSAEYQTLKDLTADLNEKLFNLKANPVANKAEIVATAQLKLAYARKLSAMEANALQSDSAVQDAKTKLVDASAKISDLRAQFQRNVRRDPKMLAARKDYQDAQIARATSTALLAGALEARDIALDYAYDLHIHDPYTYRYNPTYYDPYYNYNYGSGYATGYGYSGVYNGATSNIGADPFFRGREGRRFVR